MEVSACLPQFLKLYNDILIFAGQHVVTKMHSHHAHEIIISFDSNVVLHMEDGSVKARGLLLRKDISHATKVEGLALFIYINPESKLGKRLSYILDENNVLKIEETVLEQIKGYITDLIKNEYNGSEIAMYLTTVLVKDITQIEKNYNPDLRINNVISYIKSNLNKPLDFKNLKDIACLSESRLIHLFKKEIGIPIRKYVLWCRVQEALKYFLKGHTLTQSAHLVGFSDVAHLTRTFVTMFGMNPSQILGKFNYH